MSGWLRNKVFWILFVVSLCSQALVEAAGHPDLSGEELLVYACFQEVEGLMLLELFREYTEVNYRYFRMSTSEMIDRIIDESIKPQADFILGCPVESLLVLSEAGLLDSFIPRNPDEVSPRFRSPDGHWTGLFLAPLSIGVNWPNWQKKFPGIDPPSNLEDLLDERLAGQIIIPDPLTSGTGYAFFAALTQFWGEDKAFDYFRRLHPLVGEYTHGGFAPAQRVAAGEYLVAISFLHDQQLMRKMGFWLHTQGLDELGWTLGGFSIVRGGPGPLAAQEFAEFLTRRQAAKMLRELTESLVLHPDGASFHGQQMLEDYLSSKPVYDWHGAARRMSELKERWQREVFFSPND